MEIRFFVLNFFFCAFLIFSCSVFADKSADKNQTEIGGYTPWFTGPLLSPSAVVQPPGQIYEQAYLFDTWTTKTYNGNWHAASVPLFRSWTFLSQTVIGLFDKVDFQLIPRWTRNSSRRHVAFHIEDLPAGFDFQLVETDNSVWYPSVKLGIYEVFPTGKYQKLNAHKFGTDSTGAGSYRLQTNLVFQKLIRIYDHHYLRTRFSLIYTYFHPTHVKGLNTYGGAEDTKGTVRPGSHFSSILGFEYTLTQNWVASCECIYVHYDKTSFHGHSGFSAPGVKAIVGGPSKESIAFTPSIEYNVSARLGFILGSWFSTDGRNTPKFESIVFSFLYIYPHAFDF